LQTLSVAVSSAAERWLRPTGGSRRSLRLPRHHAIIRIARSSSRGETGMRTLVWCCSASLLPICRCGCSQICSQSKVGQYAFKNTRETPDSCQRAAFAEAQSQHKSNQPLAFCHSGPWDVIDTKCRLRKRRAFVLPSKTVPVHLQ
jgi:hypothetical protein